MAFEISGKVFVDQNRNEAFDGEPVREGVQVYVDLNGNNVFDPGEFTTTSDMSGDWSLVLDATALGKDVRYVEPFSAVNAGPDEYQLAETELDRDDIDFFSLPPIPNPEPQPGLFSASGSVFEDFDDDGQRDFGEGPVEGVRVYLDENDNGSFDTGEASTLTDARGDWFFGQFPESDFGDPLRVEAPDGFVFNGPGVTDYTRGEQGIRLFVAPEEPAPEPDCDLELVKIKEIGRNPYVDKYKLVYSLELTEEMIEGGSVRDFSLDLDLGNSDAKFIFAKARGEGVRSTFDRYTGEVEGWVKHHKPDLEAGDSLRIVVKVRNEIDPDDITCTFTDLDEYWFC